MKKRFRVVSLFMLAVMLVSTLSIFTPMLQVGGTLSTWLKPQVSIQMLGTNWILIMLV